MSVATPRQVRFTSAGERCEGDLWLPAATTGERPPLVILGHGLGATRAMGLAAYAERFCAAGLAVLAFDYRHFGGSAGEPRGLIAIPRQLADWGAAIAFARTLDDIDHERVAIWGTSFGGGHVLSVAAHTRSVAAVVAQCPFTDGLASARTLGLRCTLKVGVAAVADRLGALTGRDPVRVPAAGPAGGAALMTAPDALPGYERLMVLDPAQQPAIAARIALDIGLYRPGAHLEEITVPTLICVAEPDTVAPHLTTLRHVERAGNPHITARTYPYGHFDLYFGEAFERVVADQVGFLRTALAPTGGPADLG